MRPKNSDPPRETAPGRISQLIGISQRVFARKIGWTPAKLNELIRGKRGITADSALDLARVLKTSPELWMNLQAMWDLHIAEQKRKAS